MEKRAEAPVAPGQGWDDIRAIDPMHLVYPTPLTLSFADFLFPEMFLLGDGEGRTEITCGTGDLRPSLVLSPF